MIVNFVKQVVCLFLDDVIFGFDNDIVMWQFFQCLFDNYFIVVKIVFWCGINQINVVVMCFDNGIDVNL